MYTNIYRIYEKNAFFSPSILGIGSCPIKKQTTILLCLNHINIILT